MKYEQVTKANNLIVPERRGQRLMCCDCGLVHRFDFFLKKRGRGHVIMIRVHRDNRATAAARRKRQTWRPE